MQFHPKDLSELDELTEEHLGFSALSDGLGFTKKPSKQAELQEEPEKKTLATSGIGAIAAGPARPAPAIFGAPKNIYPTSPVMMASKPSVEANPLMEPAAPIPQRVFAFLIDTLIVLLPLSAAWWFSFRQEALSLALQNRPSALLLFGAIFAGYFLISESFGGQSLGKMFLHLYVVEDDKYQKATGLRHALLRIILFALGTACAGLGLLYAFHDHKRRPFHDRYSGSIVRKK